MPGCTETRYRYFNCRKKGFNTEAQRTQTERKVYKSKHPSRIATPGILLAFGLTRQTLLIAINLFVELRLQIGGKHGVHRFHRLSARDPAIKSYLSYRRSVIFLG